MIASDLVARRRLLPAAVREQPAAIVALAGVAGIATGFFRPAVYAGLPNLVADEELPTANSLLQAVENLAWMIGPVLGGVLLAASRARSRLLDERGHVPRLGRAARCASRRRGSSPSTAREPRPLARLARRLRGSCSTSRPLLTVLVVWNVVLLGSAAINVAEIVLAKVSLDSGDVGFGAPRRRHRARADAREPRRGRCARPLRDPAAYAGSLALMGLGFAVAAARPDDLRSRSSRVVIGAVGNGAAVVCNALLVQRGAPDELRGRAFTVIMSLELRVLGLAMVAAPARSIDVYGAALGSWRAVLRLAFASLARRCRRRPCSRGASRGTAEERRAGGNSRASRV